MSQYVINIGALPNDGTGDPLRTAFNDVNLNFDQVFTAGPVLSNIQIVDNTILTINTNGNLVLAPNGIGAVVSNVNILPNLTNTRNLGSSTLRWASLYTRSLDVTGVINLGNVANLHISGGTNGYVLQTDGTGNLNWVAQSGSGNGSPGGANTQVQFNDDGLFSGVTAFTFDQTSNTLSVPNVVTNTISSDDSTAIQVNDDLNVQGDITANDITANAFIGDGSQLLNIPVGNNGAVQIAWLGAFSNQGGTPGDTYSTLQFDSNGMPTLDGTTAYQQRVDYSPYLQVLAPRVESTDFGIVAGPAIQITGYADNVFYNTPRSAYLSVQDQANATQQWDFGILGNGSNNFSISNRTGNRTWTFGNVDVPDGLYWPDGSFQATAFVGSAQYLANPGNVTITANSTGNTTYTWTFNNDGNLTLPSNVASINYANGDPYGGSGGGANTGNLEITGTLIEIAAGATETSIVISPSGPTAGQAFVDVPDNVTANTANLRIYNNLGNIELGTNSGNSLWSFDATGNLNLPTNGDINFNGGSIAQTLNEDIYIRASDDENDGWSIYNVVDDGAGNDLTQTRLEYNQFSVRTDIQGAFPYTWQFRDSGLLEIPGDIAGNVGGNLTIKIGDQAGSDTFIDLQTRSYIGDALISNIRIANPNVTISTAGGANTWTFDDTGYLTVPGPITRPVDDTLILVTTGANGNSSSVSIDGEFGRTLLRTNDGNTLQTWEFDIAGNLTVPGNIGATNSSGLTIGSTYDVQIVADQTDNNRTWAFSGVDGTLTFPRDTSNVSTDPFLTIEGGDTPTIQSTDVSQAGPANLAIVSNYLNLSGYNGNTVTIFADDGVVSTSAEMTLIANGAFSLTNYSNTESVYITTDANNGLYQWSFDNSGNLTLPGNTFAVNYANGTQVNISGGGSANTGNVTFNDQIVIGSGDEFGGGGLYLAPAPGSIANSAVQYLRVRGGDFPTHIHLDTGNNQYFDQYFGADNKFVKLEANGNVVINADDNVSATASWTFDVNGTITLPPTSTAAIEGTVDNDVRIRAVSSGDSVSASLQNYNGNGVTTTSISADPTTVTVNADNSNWVFDSNGNLNVPQGGYIGPAGVKGDGTMLTGGTGNIASLTSFYADAPGIYSSCVTVKADGTLDITTYGNGTGALGVWNYANTTLYVPGNGSITTNNAVSGAGGNNVTVQAGAADQNNFNANPGGNLNLTGGLGGFNDDGIGGAGGDVNIIGGSPGEPGNVSGNLNITTSNVNINTGVASWAFDNLGYFRGANLSILSGNGLATVASIIEDNGSLNVLANGTGGTTQVGWLSNTSSGLGETAIMIFNEVGNTGNAVIRTGNTLADSYSWAFGNTGGLSLATVSSESAQFVGTRKIIGGALTGATAPYSVTLAAGGTPTVAYTGSAGVYSTKVTFAVASNGAGFQWEQFDVVAVPSQDVGGTVNFVVSNRVKGAAAIPDTVVTATMSGGQIQISLTLDAAQTSGGTASFDATEFGLMVD